MPDLVRYQLRDGPHAGEPTTERGEIERLARECRAAACQAGLDSTVVETRFNVVRSSVPDLVTTVRRLGDYLPPADLARPVGSGEAWFPCGTWVSCGLSSSAARDHTDATRMIAMRWFEASVAASWALVEGRPQLDCQENGAKWPLFCPLSSSQSRPNACTWLPFALAKASRGFAGWMVLSM